MIYFTSDLHFNHTNILKYQKHTRPYSSVVEMNRAIISRWNSIISPKDEVWVLGDFFMGNHKESVELIKYLNGHIHLIRGNHDYFSHKEEKELFASVQDYKVLRYEKDKYILCHYPIEEWDGCYYGRIHLHGHCHGNLQRKLPNRFDIGWDVFQRPVSIDEIKSWRTDEKVPHHGVTKDEKNSF